MEHQAQSYPPAPRPRLEALANLLEISHKELRDAILKADESAALAKRDEQQVALLRAELEALETMYRRMASEGGVPPVTGKGIVLYAVPGGACTIKNEPDSRLRNGLTERVCRDVIVEAERPLTIKEVLARAQSVEPRIIRTSLQNALKRGVEENLYERIGNAYRLSSEAMWSEIVSESDAPPDEVDESEEVGPFYGIGEIQSDHEDDLFQDE